MASRTFRLVDEECKYCEGECKKDGIPRDNVYQSLDNAKLFVYRECGMARVEEDL